MPRDETKNNEKQSGLRRMGRDQIFCVSCCLSPNHRQDLDDFSSNRSQGNGGL
jgi:hypothetical protein